ncbi:ribonuclease [Saccharomonospora sp. CUA-673]|uniref:ribonuclease domain-containing protein n=1 Tax=Saccharomonospora sp. CUA-673 TaxID=1904969 RepID=UPI0009688234|nr:ribonuclease domain-containing protein [Saccharomonospora sp. CUA-673]OLT42649.1 ribonuclease [Saccharomonospora sp. CUA-673]
MANHRSRIVTMVLGLVLALLGFAAPAAGSTATDTTHAATTAATAAATQSAVSVAQNDCGDTSGFTQVRLSSLPPEATDTYRLIENGGPYPYPQDDTVFQNREGILPACSSGYYREYTVETPGLDHRGQRRIVTGNGGEFFYTSDHYESFSLIIG